MNPDSHPDSPALFVFAHPDDEVLGAGVAIAEHLAAGQDVHLLWLTRGEASGVRLQLNGDSTGPWWDIPHNPSAEGYMPLSPADFGAARIREAISAVRLLGSGYPGDLVLHEAGLPDGDVTQPDAEAAILDVADLIAPAGPVRIKTHTHVVDDHGDHLAAGAACRALKTAQPLRFSNLRHYVLPAYWVDPRLSQVSESWDTPTDGGVAERARNAGRGYGAWSPPHTYAIGRHSVPGWFDVLDAAPKSMVHQ